MKEVSPPLIYSPLKIIPELQYFLNGSITYLKGDKSLSGIVVSQTEGIGICVGLLLLRL